MKYGRRDVRARLALHTSDRIDVLSTCWVVLEGEASELMHNETVRKAYLD